MSNHGVKLRQRLAREAARILAASPELSVSEARDAAIERLAPSGARASDLPTEADISRQLQHATASRAVPGDRFDRFAALLEPLEAVHQHPTYHPEGDALFHSLQVFDHARDRMPYDAEFLEAALLHDVGKAIDARDHVLAGLQALGDAVSHRTAWLIEHHMICHDLREGRVGSRVRKRLESSGFFEDLLALGECDWAGRDPMAVVPELEEAIAYLRMIAS